MIIFVTNREGGQWKQIDYRDATQPLSVYAAVRIGDWIYDNILKRLGYSPIRFAGFNGKHED